MIDREEILYWLRTNEAEMLEPLWERANRIRQERVGDAIHLRGLIELSSYCRRACTYCGISTHNGPIPRYRMTLEEARVAARHSEELGYGSVVLQAGEDPQLTVEWMEHLIQAIKQETSLAVTLSLGERPPSELERFRKAGADRYLLRFETSNRALFDQIHPPFPGLPDRFDILRILAELGFEVGSGVMIGIPGSNWGDLANDLQLFASLNLEMIGVGPYIAHPETPLGREAALATHALPGSDQVPADELTTYKVVALARILCPDTNIPATTALATINPANGRELALDRGANVCMPNITPVEYRERYQIYPAKACINETAAQCDGCLRGRISRIGRFVGRGPGTSPKHLARVPQPVAHETPRSHPASEGETLAGAPPTGRPAEVPLTLHRSRPNRASHNR